MKNNRLAIQTTLVLLLLSLVIKSAYCQKYPIALNFPKPVPLEVVIDTLVRQLKVHQPNLKIIKFIPEGNVLSIVRKGNLDKVLDTLLFPYQLAYRLKNDTFCIKSIAIIKKAHLKGFKIPSLSLKKDLVIIRDTLPEYSIDVPYTQQKKQIEVPIFSSDFRKRQVKEEKKDTINFRVQSLHSQTKNNAIRDTIYYQEIIEKEKLISKLFNKKTTDSLVHYLSDSIQIAITANRIEKHIRVRPLKLHFIISEQIDTLQRTIDSITYQQPLKYVFCIKTIPNIKKTNFSLGMGYTKMIPLEKENRKYQHFLYGFFANYTYKKRYTFGLGLSLRQEQGSYFDFDTLSRYYKTYSISPFVKKETLIVWESDGVEIRPLKYVTRVTQIDSSEEKTQDTIKYHSVNTYKYVLIPLKFSFRVLQSDTIHHWSIDVFTALSLNYLWKQSNSLNRYLPKLKKKFSYGFSLGTMVERKLNYTTALFLDTSLNNYSQIRRKNIYFNMCLGILWNI